MNALSWLLLVAGYVVSGVIGWMLRGWRCEVAESRAEQARDDAWDREHLDRLRGKTGQTPPGGSLTPPTSGE